MKKLTAQWVNKAYGDMQIAQLAYEHLHFLHTMFMCQQALEKIIKGYIEEKEGYPPHTHDLISLLDYAGILSDAHKDMKEFLALLTSYYIEARYPESNRSLKKYLTKRYCKQVLSFTEEAISWVKNKLQL